MFVRMLENRRVGGVIYTKDSTYDVADDLGALLVGGGWAVRTDPFIRSGNQLEAALDASGNMVGVVGPGGTTASGNAGIASAAIAGFGGSLFVTPSGGDDTARIQAAIDTVRNGGGGRVTLSAGTFTITSSLLVPLDMALQYGSFVFEGQGWDVNSGRGTTIEVVGAGNGFTMLNTRGGSNDGLIVFRDFKIRGDGADLAGGHGFSCDSMTGVLIERVMIHKMRGSGVFSRIGYSSVIRDCLILNCRINGIHLQLAGNTVHLVKNKALGNGRRYVNTTQANIFIDGNTNVCYGPVLTANDVSYAGVGFIEYLRSNGSLTSVVVASNVATVTTAAPHLRITGDYVALKGATVAPNLNSRAALYPYQITVTGATTFTFPTAGVSNETYTESTLAIMPPASGIQLAFAYGTEINGLYCEAPSLHALYVQGSAKSTVVTGGFVLEGRVFCESTDSAEIGGVFFSGPVSGVYVAEATNRASVDVKRSCTYADGASAVLSAYSKRDGQWFGAAVPTTGTWERGDAIWNTSAAAAGAPGWVCVTAGTPGTWKAMANLAP